MKRTLLFLFCALMSTQMFSETLFGYLFPTLAYLERTSCHYMEGNEQNRTLNRLSFEDNMFEIDGNYYIEYNDMWLREDKEGRIFVYSEPAKKDLVLYDFTLEVGDTLTTLNVDQVPMTEGDPILPGVKPVVVDYPIHLDEYVSFPIDTLIVTDVSMVMMCDSNQYKKWTFSNGMEYMEYIGNLSADFFAIIRNPWEELPTCCVEEDLVCASIYDRLVYLMDDEKRDLLNIDCPCTSWSNKWQWRTNTWNVLQFDGMAFEQTAQTWQYKLAHDTIIGGKEYTAVTRHWTAYDESAAEYVAAVRFAENKKAFIYYDNAEYLLYDFGYHEIGDTLEVFSGINNYEHFKTYKCVITDNYSTEGGIAEDTYVMDIIDPIIGNTIPAAMIWEEFVGSYSGFLHGGLLVPGNSNYQLLCAYKDNVLAYSVDNDAFTDNDTFIEYGCEYNANDVNNNFNEPLIGQWRGVDRDLIVSISDSIISIEKIGLSHKYIASATQLQIERLWAQEDEPHRSANCDYWLHGDTLWIDSIVPSLAEIYPPIFSSITLVRVKNEELFPTLAGLQRTSCTKTIGEDEYGTVWGSRSYLMQETQTTTIDGKQYIVFGDEYDRFALREENNKILLYSSILKKDLVLYDFTLGVGDSLPALYFEWRAHDTMHQWLYIGDIVDYNKDDDGTILPAETFVVTDISTITLLDGKEYKKWTFDNGMEYVEGIGSFGTSYAWNDFYQLIANGPLYSDVHSQHLVCVSKNGKLLYQMDDAEMERLGAECLCEVETSYKSQWCDTWNVMWFDGMRFDETASTSQYRLGKDTIIGDYTYSKFTSRTSVRFTSDRKVYVYYEGFDDNDPYTEDLPTGEYLAYDFSAQVGDTLEVFSGSHSYTTEQCVVYGVQTDPETNLRTIMLHPLCVVDGDGNVGVSEEEITWLEGVGSPNGFLISTPLPGGGSYVLLCAYKDDELKYTGSFYEHFGCEYNAGVVSDDLFPTLSGLQRTICREYCEQADNKTRIEQFTNLTTRTETGGPYLYYSPFLLREKDNKILIYSRTLNKDLVLYDFNLQVGDSLPMLYIDFFAKDDWIADRDMEIWCVVDYHKDLEGNILPADTLIVTDVSAITLLDGKEYKKWTFNNGMEYVEGIGSFGNRQWSGDFFQLIANRDVPTSLQGEHLVCASKNGQLLYKMDDAEMEQLETECLCEYNAEQKPEDLFPTLWGLQRTSCDEWYDGCGENKSYLFAPKEVKEINGKLYLKCGGVFLREEDSKVLIYSFPYEKDFVLYDYTLEVGGTLQNLGIDIYSFPELEYAAVVDYIAYEDYDVETDEFIIKKEPLGSKRVTEVSTITLLDGKEYKRWLFGNDWENGNYYVEGIGNVGGSFGGDYINIANPYALPTCYMGEHLVCASKNNKLLYQMDDEEMERLGVECLCDYDRGPRKDNAKNGKIGGRPTPTQWNMLEVETKEMDGTPTILRAETFSYTLENDSIVTKGKTFYQLARQSTKDTAITKSFVGALHFGEDEDNRVYFLRDGVEYVLYDFTAEPGDTIEIFAGINNYPQETTYTHVVTGKDSLENGACRMMLEVVFPEEIGSDLEQQHLQKIWLAGLGSIDGIVHNAAQRTSDAHAAPARSAHSSDTQTSIMLCAWREDSCLYTTNHPEYDTFGCVYNQDPTAVENLTSPSSYQKIIHEGTLLILHEGKVYNVIGIQIK